MPAPACIQQGPFTFNGETSQFPHAVYKEGNDAADDRHQYHASDLDLAGDPDDGNWSIRCLDVHKRLGGVPVLDGLNVAFPDDTITVVLGPSGTGKSVLIKHIIGLMFPDSGDIDRQGQSRSRR